jgi:hypothetical protein
MGDVTRTRTAAERKRRVVRPAGDGPAPPAPTPAPEPVPVPLDPDLLAGLEDQRRFLDRSRRDLDREFEAGDLDPADYDALRSDYETRIAKVDAAIAGGKAGLAAARPRRSLWRTAGVVFGVAAFAVVAGVLVANFAGRRDPGETITGNDPRTENRTQLVECIDLDRRAAAGEVELSVPFQCYDELFNRNPDDPLVLASFGWFLYQAGSRSGQPEPVQAGAAFIDQAIELDPDYPDAHAYRLVILNNEGRTEEARAELATLDSLNPPPIVRQLIEPIRQRLAAPG